MEAVSATVNSHMIIVFAVENYYCKWFFFGPVYVFLFLQKNDAFDI